MAAGKVLCVLLSLQAYHLVSGKGAASSASLLVEEIHAALEKMVVTSLLGNTTQCQADLSALSNSTQVIRLASGTQQLVNTLEVVVDAFGKPSSGILQGDIQFTGSYDECLSIQHITMQYCVMTETYFINTQTNTSLLPSPVLEGVCIPKSCNLTEFMLIVNQHLEEYVIVSNASNSFCSSPGRPELTNGAISMIIVSGFFVVMVIVGTAFHCLETSFREIIKERERNSITLKRGILNVGSDPDSSIQVEDTPLLGKPKVRQHKRLMSFFHELILSFSLYKTVPTILSTNQPPSAITSINGIRTISMFWVILAHVMYWLFLVQGLKNVLDFETKFGTRFSAQPVMNAYFAVDSFFFLSGLLVSYLTLRDMSRKKGRFPFVRYYVHRFLRLTPTYMFLLFFYWYLTMYLADGPRYLATTGPGSKAWNNCESYWWTNLLYINNFYPVKFADECMGWTWYLADDMQYYVITPLILIPLNIWLPAGIAAIFLLLVGSIGITGFVAGYYRLPANLFAFMYYNVTAGPEFPDASTEIYAKPYTRIAPYLVGIVLGYILFNSFRPVFRKPLNWAIYLGMWCVAAVLCISSVYGMYKTFNGHPFSLAENVTYFMFARLAWGVGLALVVFACHNGYGGVINRFLSMPFWVPLSRFTFSTYLIHPIVLTVLLVSQRYPFYYADVNIVMFTIASVVLSYGAAGVVCVFVEFPLSNVEIAVFNLLGLSRRDSIRQFNQQPPLGKGGLEEIKT